VAAGYPASENVVPYSDLSTFVVCRRPDLEVITCWPCQAQVLFHCRFGPERSERNAHKREKNTYS
jgi:hypothetical protein